MLVKLLPKEVSNGRGSPVSVLMDGVNVCVESDSFDEVCLLSSDLCSSSSTTMFRLASSL